MTDKTLVAIVLALSVVGCKRSSDAPPAPTTMPATTSPTTEPVSLPTSVVTIDGSPTAFPTCRIKLDDTTSAGSVTVVLYTDDAALVDDRTANTVLLSMPVSVDDVTELPSSSCHITGQSKDAENDTPNGLFLNGSTIQLVPIDVDVTFTGDAHVITATISGTFNRLALDAKERDVVVKGVLSARVDE